MAKILIIEDNEANLYLMKFMLSKFEHKIIEARDGMKGVELAISEEPDLILMDIQIPILDGYSQQKK